MTDELFREDAYLARCQALVIALDGLDLYLDRTVLYPTGGGQPGDRGRLVLADGSTLPVADTLKGTQGIAHRLAEGTTAPAAGTELTAEVDWPRRYRLMRMHSAMHLLCAAVACPVTGGQVGEAKSRLDFDLQGQAVDKDEVAAKIARWIADDRPIRHFWIDAGELEARPELVRTMSVRPPTTGGRVRLVEIEGVDLQACGGTHVRSTREIGALAVGKLENKGRQNRRISLSLPE
ncbi:MAG TPA: alanyl-tRNA editing protein [Geminicoccaceae bacterium]|jgi:misacylated tRNA(Ala) deacylase|nr:alanyl-tRNA editing protein [Geminicoccaceae bacterium]